MFPLTLKAWIIRFIWENRLHGSIFCRWKGKLKGKTKVNSILTNNTENLIQDNNPLYIEKSSNISDAIIKISNFVGESVPVVDGDRILKGVVTESDLFIEYLKVQDKISEIEKD